MHELRGALDAVRWGRAGSRPVPWATVDEIRTWLHTCALPPPQPPQPPAAAAQAAAAPAMGEEEEQGFAERFSWGAAKLEAEAEELEARGGDGAPPGQAVGQGGRELRVMERVAAKLRAELAATHEWFALVRAEPDAAAATAVCSQVQCRPACALSRGGM